MRKQQIENRLKEQLNGITIEEGLKAVNLTPEDLGINLKVFKRLSFRKIKLFDGGYHCTMVVDMTFKDERFNKTNWKNIEFS